MSSFSARIRIADQSDLLTTIPRLLGFLPEPSGDLVIIGYGGPNGICLLRFTPQEATRLGAADHYAALLRRRGFPEAFMVGYGPADLIEPAMSRFINALTSADITVRSMIRVTDGLWFGPWCQDHVCCPPQGTPVPHMPATTVQGAFILPDRATRKASLTRVTGPRAHAVDEATLTAEQRTAALTVHELRPRRLELIRRITATPSRPLDADTIAELSLALHDLRVRDEAVVRVDPDDLAPSIELWTRVLRLGAPRHAAASASVLAYCAILAGDGCLANMALDIAEATDPNYSLADILRTALNLGIPPRDCAIGLTPEALAAAYGEQ